MDNATITMDILYLVYNKSDIHAKKNITRLCKETSYYFDRILHKDCLKELTPEKIQLFYQRNQNNGSYNNYVWLLMLKSDFEKKYEISQINMSVEFYGDDNFINSKNRIIRCNRKSLILSLECLEDVIFNEGGGSINNIFKMLKKYKF